MMRKVLFLLLVCLLSLQTALAAPASYSYEFIITLINPTSSEIKNAVVEIPLSTQNLINLGYVSNDLRDLIIEDANGNLASHSADIGNSFQLFVPSVPANSQVKYKGYLRASPRATPWGFSGFAQAPDSSSLNPGASSFEVKGKVLLGTVDYSRLFKASPVGAYSDEWGRNLAFYNGNYYLVYWGSDNQVKYRATSDLVNWTAETSLPPLPDLPAPSELDRSLSLVVRGGYAFVVVAAQIGSNTSGTEKLYVIRGTVSGLSITWGNWITIATVSSDSATDLPVYTSIELDSLGRPFILWSYRYWPASGGAYSNVVAYRSSVAYDWSTPSSWTLYSYQGAADTPVKPVALVPLTNNKMSALYQAVDTNQLLHRVFDGVNWGTPEVIASGDVSALSAVSFGDNVYAAYSFGDDVWFRARVNGTWQAEQLVEDFQDTNTSYPSLSLTAFNLSGNADNLILYTGRANGLFFRRTAVETISFSNREVITTSNQSAAKSASYHPLAAALIGNRAGTLERLLVFKQGAYGIWVEGNQLKAGTVVDSAEYLLTADITNIQGPTEASLIRDASTNTLRLLINGAERASMAIASGNVSSSHNLYITDGFKWTFYASIIVDGIKKAEYFGKIDGVIGEDLSGNNNHASVVGYPADTGLQISLSPLSPVSLAIVPGVVLGEVPGLVGKNPPPQPARMYQEGSGAHLPLGDVLEEAAQNAGIPSSFLWIAISTMVSVLLGFFVYAKSRSSLVTAIVMGVVLAFFSLTGVLPFWTVFVYGIMAAGIIIFEQKFAF